MNSKRLGILLAIGSGTLVALLCWLVVLLEPVAGDGQALPLEAPGVDPIETLDLPRVDEPESRPGPAPERQALELPPPPRLGPQALLGRVLGAATRKPVEAFQVYVLAHGQAAPERRLERVIPLPFRVRSGVFRIDKAPGLYDLVVKAPGFEPGVLREVEVPALDGRPLEILLETGPGIVGRVYNVQNLAVPDVKVFLHVLRLDDPTASPPRVTVAHAAADGRFSFSPLPPGE